MSIIKLVRDISRSKIKKSPFYTHYYITRRCFFKCRMCSIWKYGNKDEEPSLDVIKRIAERMSSLGVGNVVFTGGEPFIRKDLPEIIKIFRDEGLTVRLQTTGAPNISDKMLEDAINSGVSHLTVSLDTLDKDKQDDICQSKGLWDSAVRIIKRGLDLIPNGVVVVNTVVTRENIEELPELVEFVSGLGAYSSLVPVHLVKSKDLENPIRSFCDDFQFRDSDLPTVKRIYKELLRMKKEGYLIGSSSKFLKDSMETIITGSQKWICDAGKYYFIVYPDGSVSICDDYPARWNILDSDFVEKFQSRETKMEIEKMINDCSGCIYGCWRETSYLLNYPGVLLEQTRNFGKRLIFGKKRESERGEQ